MFTFLDKILPNNEWHEFEIDTQQIVNWTNPIVISNDPCVVPSLPNYPDPTKPWITYLKDDTTAFEYGNYKLNQGIFNITN